MPLPILPSTTDIRTITERVNPLIKFYNREDTRMPIFALDTGSATAYAIAPIPGIEMYVVGQIFGFKALNANTGTAPTLNVNSVGAGTITYPDGSALVIGDIAANGFYEVIVASTTPTFHLMGAKARGSVSATTFLGADVNLNNTANYFNGPNTGSIGANGQVWLIIGVGALQDTAGAATFTLSIHDGTNYRAETNAGSASAGGRCAITVALVAVLTTATTFTLRARDLTSTSGILSTTGAAGTANISTSISAVRLA